MSKYRIWSVPTSPRNPFKLPSELKLLSQFEGSVWNKTTQIEYSKKLAKSDFFEGNISGTAPDFSARDRINRAPKTYGFVDFGNRNKIRITEAGKRLINGEYLDDLFLRQLLKWQYPSIKHPADKYIGFKIKPFLEMLRLAFELAGITKKELAIFGVTLINYDNYDSTKEEIVAFRKKLSEAASKRDRLKITIDTHIAKLKAIYSSEISSGKISLRQRNGKTVTEKDFLTTKLRNCIDYSDAGIRYFRATGLFVFSANAYRLKIADIKNPLVKSILEATSRVPVDYTNQSEFTDYFYNPIYPSLPYDNKDELIKELLNINALTVKEGVSSLPDNPEEYLHKKGLLELRKIKDNIENKYKERRIYKEIVDIQSYNQYADIQETFNKIIDRTDVDIPDKPLFFEWNTWRALNMLDDGDILGNLKLDFEGKPLSNASGKMSDIVCYYNNFVLVVEVTLTNGATQYEAEGEPVARHLAGVKKILRQKGDNRPVYGLFLAVNINEAVIAHFYSIRKQNISFYGGKTNFIPLPLSSFQQLLENAKSKGGVTSQDIFNFIKWADNQADTSIHEADWYSKILNKTSTWTVISP